jgi:hypothetical protein
MQNKRFTYEDSNASSVRIDCRITDASHGIAIVDVKADRC